MLLDAPDDIQWRIRGAANTGELELRVCQCRCRREQGHLHHFASGVYCVHWPGNILRLLLFERTRTRARMGRSVIHTNIKSLAFRSRKNKILHFIQRREVKISW